MPENPSSPDDAAVLLATRNWLERAVIGLALCPFAKGVHAKKQIRYALSRVQTTEALLGDLARELRELSLADPNLVDTTLLIHPDLLGNFLDYNDFLSDAAAKLAELGFEGELQIASFHPDYRFAGNAPEDMANWVNRSPYPMLHLLREASVDRAVEAFPDASQIYGKNITTLRSLGHAGLQRVLEGHATATTPERDP